MGAYRYQIREVATGRTALCGLGCGADATTCAFYWLEGGMSCDCNRKLSLDRALGTEGDVEGDNWDYPCNTGPNAYVFDWVELDGVRFIENDQPTEHAR